MMLGGLSATGLTFDQTEAVAMEEERLFLGIDTVAVGAVMAVYGWPQGSDRQARVARFTATLSQLTTL